MSEETEDIADAEGLAAMELLEVEEEPTSYLVLKRERENPHSSEAMQDDGKKWFK